MEKIIFFGLVIPILIFIFYLGGNAIMKGISARNSNKENDNEHSNEESKLSDEINKLNKLLKEGILTQEEFEKAKKKLLDD